MELALFFIGFFSSKVLSSLLYSAKESSMPMISARQAAKPPSCYFYWV